MIYGERKEEYRDNDVGSHEVVGLSDQGGAVDGAVLLSIAGERELRHISGGPVEGDEGLGSIDLDILLINSVSDGHHETLVVANIDAPDRLRDGLKDSGTVLLQLDHPQGHGWHHQYIRFRSIDRHSKQR